MTVTTTSNSHHRRGSSKLVSIESTPDGDITTVEETETTTDADNNIANVNNAFRHHLRDSWDDGPENGENANNTAGGGAGGGAGSTRRHKQNLSVQFTDFSISEDVLNDSNRSIVRVGVGGGVTPSSSSSSQQREQQQQQQQQEQQHPPKETIESTAAYYLDESLAIASTTNHVTPSITTDDPPADEHDETMTTIDDYTNFTKNIRNSWDLEESSNNSELDSNNGNNNNNDKNMFRHHKQSHSVQFLDTAVLDYSVDDMEQYDQRYDLSFRDNEDREVGSNENNNDDGANSSAAVVPATFDPPTERKGASSLEDDNDDNNNDNPPTPQPTTPTSPSSVDDNDIIVPIPIRPVPLVAVAPSVNRKHRRVFSGRSNPAMAHRRVNTRGDKCAPRRNSNWRRAVLK